MGGPEPDDLPALKDPPARVTVAITPKSESNFYVGCTAKVSGAGVFVATPTPIGVGRAVELAIELPGQEPVRARGTVRWLQESSEADGTVSGMGVRIDRLAHVDARRILEFARARPPMIFDDEEGATRGSGSPFALVG
jgi:Tfp pilus assembly protein PilZ